MLLSRALTTECQAQGGHGYVSVCAYVCIQMPETHCACPLAPSYPLLCSSACWIRSLPAATFGDATAFHYSTSLRLHGSFTETWTPLQGSVPSTVIFSSDSCSSCFFFLHNMWVARKPEGPTSQFPYLDLGLNLHHIFLKQ